MLPLQPTLPIYHRARRLIPERIGRCALVDDDKGVGYAPRFVYGFLVLWIEGVERIEAPPQGVVHLGGLERIENHDLLVHARGVLRSRAPSGGCDGGVFALGIDDANRPRPGQQRRDYPGCALAAPRSAHKTDMAVVDIAEGSLVFTGAPQPDHAVAVHVAFLDLVGVRPF